MKEEWTKCDTFCWSKNVYMIPDGILKSFFFLELWIFFLQYWKNVKTKKKNRKANKQYGWGCNQAKQQYPLGKRAQSIFVFPSVIFHTDSELSTSFPEPPSWFVSQDGILKQCDHFWPSENLSDFHPSLMRTPKSPSSLYAVHVCGQSWPQETPKSCLTKNIAQETQNSWSEESKLYFCRSRSVVCQLEK